MATTRCRGGEWKGHAWVVILVAALATLALACGGDDDGNGGTGTGTGTTSSGTGGSSSGTGGSSSGTGGSSSGTGGSTSSGTGGSGAGASGLPDVGTLVVLGDSIGDGGGQPPYYYNLLRDALNAFYGPIDYQNGAESGSETPALVGQINGLPGSLPGPVAVAITSGGNDMKSNLASILAGTDGPARTQMGNNIAAALSALLAPDRFGPGVEVFVFYANIYDASDGVGNYQTGGCAVGINSPLPVDPFFDNWNGEIETRVLAAAQTPVDMHGYFYGHGFNNPPNWYAGDCTHPNTVGHDQLRQLFFSMITTGHAP